MHRDTVWAGICLFAICIIAYATIGGLNPGNANLGGLAYASATSSTPGASAPASAITVLNLRLNGNTLVSGMTVNAGQQITYTRADGPGQGVADVIVVDAFGTGSATGLSMNVARVYGPGTTPVTPGADLLTARGQDMWYGTVPANVLAALVAKDGAGWYRIHADAQNSVSEKTADAYLFVMPSS